MHEDIFDAYPLSLRHYIEYDPKIGKTVATELDWMIFLLMTPIT